MVSGDVGDRATADVRAHECPVRLMNASQPKISVRRHPQMLLAMQAKCAIGYADGRANFSQIERLALVCPKELLEPLHDRYPSAERVVGPDMLSFRQADHHGSDQFILDGPGDLWMRQKIRRGFC